MSRTGGEDMVHHLEQTLISTKPVLDEEDQIDKVLNPRVGSRVRA